jgi:hypothetical protein
MPLRQVLNEVRQRYHVYFIILGAADDPVRDSLTFGDLIYVLARP